MKQTERVELWALVHAERAALATDLAGLTDEQWTTPSLCEGLSVREVLAHLTSAASLNGWRWFAGVLKCRFDFDAQVLMRLREQLGADAAATLDRFRGVVTSTVKPPLPLIAMLGETIVHGEDIRRPLCIVRDYPVEVLTRLADYYAGSNQLLPGRKRANGLRLTATDGPLDTGAGPQVSGTTLALMMAVTGRRSFLAELDGEGVPVLRQRLRDIPR